MVTPKGEINDALLKWAEKEENIAAITKTTSKKEAYEIVKKEVADISEEEFEKSIRIMFSYLDMKEEGVLSEEELEAVAGGKGGPSGPLPSTPGFAKPGMPSYPARPFPGKPVLPW